MIRRTFLAAAASIGALALAGTGFAAERMDWDKAKFEKAQKDGRPILVDVAADWCPVCKKQAPIIADLAKKPEYKNLATFRVDFDKQKEALKQFNVQKQSTLIVFKGTKETGRSTGDSNAESIAKLLATSVK